MRKWDYKADILNFQRVKLNFLIKELTLQEHPREII